MDYRQYFSLYLLIALLIIITLSPLFTQAQDEYPIPLSESSEIIAPGTAVLLCYPKYFRNANDEFEPVDTTLQPSSSPDWDYEVTTGIWQLSINTNGTFQARHDGDVFSYRFQNLGIGMGDQFRTIDLGIPDFSNYQVEGNLIRWNNVFADVDLLVRYIHDILKVDVIVKQSFMDDLRSEMSTGGLDPTEYLTARF